MILLVRLAASHRSNILNDDDSSTETKAPITQVVWKIKILGLEAQDLLTKPV